MKEFQKFISKGNVIEIAVGLIMATYFGAIAKSLVNDVLMPPIGLLLGGVDFSNMKLVLKGASADGSVAEVAINYGLSDTPQVLTGGRHFAQRRKNNCE